MRIKQLDISGFKSFSDQTKIIFNNAVTAVVGPNGCGKSNIVDAIRWALGEQSAKNLRGRAMDDVIFNGSKTRGRQSMAEVTLTFDNTDGLSDTAYVDFTEVAVTRRLHRDGTSEYLINKTPCRLMDITKLFLGTGGGARAYSIIEQGRIGLIVSSRPEDRRGMIEEAAGITKYKAARRTAARKMEKTRQNLLRINDIISEMERTLASLKRQAKKAARYKRYRDEQSDLDLHISAHKYLELRSESMVIAGALERGGAALGIAKTDLDTLETRIETLRVEEQRAKSLLDETTGIGYEVNKEIQVIENEIGHLLEAVNRYRGSEINGAEQEATALNQLGEMEQEAALLSSQLEKIDKDRLSASARHEELKVLADAATTRLDGLADAHNRDRDQLSRCRARQAAAQTAIQNFGQRVEENKARLDAAKEDRLALKSQTEELKASSVDLAKRASRVERELGKVRSLEERELEVLNQLKLRVEQTDGDRLETRDQLQAQISTRASLEEVMDGLESHDHAVKEAVELIGQENGDLIEGLLIDYIECPEEYENALAAVLNDRLQAIVVNDRKSGLELLTLLRERDMGRVTVLSKKGMPSPGAEGHPPQDKAIIGALSVFLEVEPAAAGFVDQLLSRVFVVADVKQAERLWKKSGSFASFVTLDGQLLESGGAMRGGRGASAGADLLRQKRRIRELGKEIKKLSAKRKRLDERFDALKDELRARTEAGENARQDAQNMEISLAEVRKDSSRAREDLEQLGHRFEAMDREIAHQREMLRSAKIDLQNAQKERTNTGTKIEGLEESLHKREAEIQACRQEADELNNAESDLRVQQAALDQQRESANSRLIQISGIRTETDLSIEKLVSDRVKAAQQMGRAAGDTFRQRELLLAKIQEAERIDSRVRKMREDLETSAAAVEESQAGSKSLREAVDDIQVELSSLKMKDREVSLAVEHLLDNVRERTDCELLRVLGDYHMREIPGVETRARMDDLNRLIDRMGPINLAAIDEFERETERHESLVGQRDDLEQALEDLERAIARMDKDSKKRFKESFEDINRRFIDLFPRLFNGGQAKLSLTDPTDMLATGVDISAQPPGKRLGNVELMSGGEKALTAVALLFAIFLHRPSPFCILDEVDAPLDEANIDRFIDVVQRMTDRSQFILITHSKLTMERSDALYGVTMEEAGISKMVSVRFNTLTDSVAVNS